MVPLMEAGSTDINPPPQPKEKVPRTRRRSWAWACFIALVLALSGWFIAVHVGSWKDRFIPRKFRTVEPGAIYASGQIDRHLIGGILSDYKIREIVCLIGHDPTDPDSAAEFRIAHDMNIDRLYFPLSGDGTGDIHEYADAITAIVAAQKAGKPVLVHCSSGSQRTNGAIYFYRVLIQHRSSEEAANEMYRNGYDPHFNPLLIPYLNEHIAEMAALLVQKGVIDQVPTPLPQIPHD
jgi:protein tyrosine phosphatase (PTP) superfamily phosphohydrolase (DUF442 family)